MYYKFVIEDHIRVAPNQFELDKDKAILEKIKEKFDGMISKEMGFVIDCVQILNIGRGVIIPGDGAVYYPTKFELLTYNPENSELVHSQVRDIADFGGFLRLGPIDGMVHLTQTMNDYVSFSKDKVLQGKDTKQILKIGDKCIARIIAVSYKDISNPKIGLTMRQDGLGSENWRVAKK